MSKIITTAAFVAALEDNDAVAIDPEEFYNQDALQFKGDKPAFRQYLVDSTDAMEKDHQWVTFDNGEFYYTADDIKDLLQQITTKHFGPALRDKLAWWL